MSYTADTFIHKGLTIKIIADEDAQAPENDDGIFIVTTRNRYFELLQNGMDAGQWMEDAKEHAKKYWIFPLQAYIHSGVALSLHRGGQFSDPWDSGQIGFVFVAKSESKYRTRERKKCVSAFTMAKNYMESWNQYLSGDVWGFDISQDGESLDSCWGFYGMDYCKHEAIESAECCLKSSAKVDRMEAETFAL